MSYNAGPRLSRRKLYPILGLALAATAIPVAGAAGASGKTVTLKDIAFSSKSVSISRTFSSAGTYRYTCTLHPGMSGRIVVR